MIPGNALFGSIFRKLKHFSISKIVYDLVYVPRSPNKNCGRYMTRAVDRNFGMVQKRASLPNQGLSSSPGHVFFAEF